MHKCRRYGPDKSERTDGRPEIHLSKIVTTKSRFTASGLDKQVYKVLKKEPLKIVKGVDYTNSIPYSAEHCLK